MNASARTAIKRKKLSAPMKWLLENNKLIGWVLDYGCGKGDDVRILNDGRRNGYVNGFFRASGWDLNHIDSPAFCDNYWKHQWQVVTCNYVLNVIPPQERKQVIEDLLSLDARDVYVTVRRDLKADYKTTWGTEQYLVHLDYPIVKKTSGFCIYKIK